MYMGVLPAGMSVHHVYVYLVPTEVRGGVFWNWNYRVTLWVLGIKPGSGAGDLFVFCQSCFKQTLIGQAGVEAGR